MEPEEGAEAFDTLKTQGKVRAFGVSNHNPMQIELLNQATKGAVEVNQIQFSVAHCPTIDAGLNVNIQNDAGCNRDGSVLEYCRLKNISLGYTLPQQITRKAHIEKLRIYVSGENLFFWSPLKKYAKNYDPEMITAGDADFASKTGTDGQGYGYPMTRSVTIGLNINF